MISRSNIVLTGLAGALIAPAAFGGTVVAFTSFEEPAAVGGSYIDTLDAATDHDLLDNAGEPIVNYISTGGELGFTSSYTSTGGTGLVDGDFVGVTAFTGTVGAYTDGVQGFQMSDTDGIMTLAFDTVIGATDLSIDLFVAETGWETSGPVDNIRVWVETDGGDIDLLDTAGADIDDLGIEGAWMTLTADISGAAFATLHVSLESNSASESIFLDNVVFTGVPTPGALALLAVAGVAGTRRRRG